MNPWVGDVKYKFANCWVRTLGRGHDKCKSVCGMFPGAGLHSQQWGRKACAARAVKALCELGGKGSLSQHAASIARQLLQVCLPTSMVGCLLQSSQRQSSGLQHLPLIAHKQATCSPF